VIYVTDVEITAGKTAEDPARGVLKVTRGLVYRIEIEFPLGCVGLVGVQVYDGGFQVWPINPGEWLKKAQGVISFDDIYLKLQPPFEFAIHGYNSDDTYTHTPIVRIGLVSPEAYQARYLPTVAYKIFEERLKTLEAEERVRLEAITAAPFSWVKEPS